ncbi:MAG: hypothetical protein AB1765_08540 [Candidatus Hydrogenedentota bacterium]
MKKLDFFRKQGLIIKELPGINDDYFTRSQSSVETILPSGTKIERLKD